MAAKRHRAADTTRRPALVLALLATAASAVAQESAPRPDDWTILRSDREATAPAGAEVVVENPFGDVRVRVGESERVSVHAVVQRAEADPREARVAIGELDRSLQVSVGFDDAAAASVREGWERRRVDLSVAVPAGSPLRVTTRGGLIEIKGGVGELHADSQAGEVRLWIEREATVRTVRGTIQANLLGERWSAPASFETVTGDVDVHFPANADVEVHLETAGDLTTDYSLEVGRLGELRKRATARLGAGGARVVLRSERGNLAIRRRIGTGAAPPDRGGVAR